MVTQPDRRRGRGTRLDPSPVKAAALELGLEVVEDLSRLAELGVDLGVVVAYGRIIPASVLRAVPMVNIHFSLLPRWRGAAPVERAILAGDARTGVCLMEVAEGLDEGGVYARVEVDIGPHESAAELRARLAEIGADLLVDRLRHGLGRPEPQAGEVTYAAKLDADEFRLSFEPTGRRAAAGHPAGPGLGPVPGPAVGDTRRPARPGVGSAGGDRRLPRVDTRWVDRARDRATGGPERPGRRRLGQRGPTPPR